MLRGFVCWTPTGISVRWLVATRRAEREYHWPCYPRWRLLVS